MPDEAATAVAEPVKETPKADGNGEPKVSSSLKDQNAIVAELDQMPYEELVKLGKKAARDQAEHRKATQIQDGWKPKSGWESPTQAPAAQPEPPSEESEAETKSEEATDNPPPTDEKKAATETVPAEKSDEDEDFQVDEKGRFYVRPKRGKELLAAKAERDLLKQQLETLTTKLFERSNAEPAAAKEIDAEDPRVAIEKRINEAKEKFKKAKADFDTEAELAANEELADAKARLIALDSENRMRGESATASWQRQMDDSESRLSKQRDAMWAEDVARFPELRDKSSDLYRQAAAITQGWSSHKNPILLHPNAYRMAAEIAAASLGMEIPAIPTKAVVATPPPAEKAEPPKQQPGRTQELRKKQTVIQRSTPGGGPMGTTEDLLAELDKLSPEKAMKVLEEFNRSRR